jgi:hypothetical protein
MIKYHPILFSTPMVQAILEGRKTQTRRLIKPAPIDKNNYHFEKLEKFGRKTFGMVPNQGVEIDNINVFAYNGIWVCPYEIGDILWVRETFVPKEIHEEPPGTKAHYKASDLFASEKWKPSIFMPKLACRIFLKIKSIRVERLMEISEEDAKAEGVFFNLQFKKYRCYLCETKGHVGSPSCDDGFFIDAGPSFYTLWISINKAESFKANPWVWVYEFERTEKPLDFVV